MSERPLASLPTACAEQLSSKDSLAYSIAIVVFEFGVVLAIGRECLIVYLERSYHADDVRRFAVAEI
jgi:hypothetical protein